MLEQGAILETRTLAQRPADSAIEVKLDRLLRCALIVLGEAGHANCAGGLAAEAWSASRHERPRATPACCIPDRKRPPPTHARAAAASYSRSPPRCSASLLCGSRRLTRAPGPALVPAGLRLAVRPRP